MIRLLCAHEMTNHVCKISRLNSKRLLRKLQKMLGGYFILPHPVYQTPDDRAKTEAETMRQSRGRGSKVETEARPCEAEARPSQLKICLEAASSRGRCLEDSILAKWCNFA